MQNIVVIEKFSIFYHYNFIFLKEKIFKIIFHSFYIGIDFILYKKELICLIFILSQHHEKREQII